MRTIDPARIGTLDTNAHATHRRSCAAQASRDALEHAAYDHLDAAPHLRRFATKALAMHLADTVWTATERHLFRDASGKTQGTPRVTRWYEFRRIPGRARSHRKDRKWETFRLHGTLAGHRAAYTGSDGRFFQPRHLRGVEHDASWWDHDGPLAVVFTGLPDGDVVLPVRLPAAPANQPILDHHLADPARWHKIDLVRRRDPNAAGGWRYEAHLIVLTAPYASPATIAARKAAAIHTAKRSAGIDVNVSNITVASHEGGRGCRSRASSATRERVNAATNERVRNATVSVRSTAAARAESAQYQPSNGNRSARTGARAGCRRSR
jgi:hypothetical protein